MEALIPTAYAKILQSGTTEAPKEKAPSTLVGTKKEEPVLNVTELLTDVFIYSVLIFAFIIISWLSVKAIRMAYEMITASRLVYMKVTLPRADSKLDKERETKKDFKEKMGIMSIFYKGIHKISEANLKETLMNLIFEHAKVSLELIYDAGQVHFYVVTYKEYGSLIAQQITSNYPDAEVKIIKKQDYVDIKPKGYTLKAASIGKKKDNIYPIKTFRYFEDDPLSIFTNAFGSLKPEDKAAYQIIIKPVGNTWNRKAKRAARLVAKGEYKKEKVG